jgi:glycosyltransferase involved in cell wall biosynthesis
MTKPQQANCRFFTHPVNNISVCILAKNSERSLSAALASVSRFAEVILLDTGSTDGTMKLARTFPNVQVRESEFSGFGPLRNQAAEMASYDWILALDSDEVLSDDLIGEILALPLDEGSVYEIDFRNYYNGKWIRGCGWHPERHIRLYHRRHTRFSDSKLHEGVLADRMRIIRLRHPIHHTPYRTAFDFLFKMQLYSDLFAKENRGKRSSSFSKAIGHALAAFFKSYFLKRGLFLGQDGFVISFYNANTAFYKYLKLAEENKSL